MKILIVEDDAAISGPLRQGLEECGYTVVICRDGERGLGMAKRGSFSAIILDVMIPSMDGMALCRNLREARVTTPVLMLTAMDTLPDRVEGLESGADDYLGKPFEFAELLARLRALIRRDKIVKMGVIRIADLEIDTRTRKVARAGTEIVLTQREYTLLEALASNEGQIVTRETILDRVWLNEDSTANSVSVYIRVLRKKIDEDHEPKLIHTVVGMGYTLRPTAPGA